MAVRLSCAPDSAHVAALAWPMMREDVAAVLGGAVRPGLLPGSGGDPRSPENYASGMASPSVHASPKPALATGVTTGAKPRQGLPIT